MVDGTAWQTKATFSCEKIVSKYCYPFITTRQIWVTLIVSLILSEKIMSSQKDMCYHGQAF